MSKNLRTAAANQQAQESIKRVLAECDNKDCAFCTQLRQVLDKAEPTPLHLD